MDFDTTKFPSDETEAREGLRKRIKFELLDLKLKGANLADSRERVARRFRTRQTQLHRWDDDRLMGVFIKALAAAYDSQGSYFSPAQIEETTLSSTQALEGVGVAVTAIDGELVATRLVPGGAAAKDGRLRRGDWITGVGQGENGAIVDLKGVELSSAVRQMRGKAGTVCRIRILRKGESEPRIFALTRSKVQQAEVRSAIVERGRKDRGPKDSGQPLRIGYVRVPVLYVSGSRSGTVKSSANDVRAAFTDPQRGFATAGIDVAILDLRNNVGGSLGEVGGLAGLFIGSGPMLQEKGATSEVERMKSDTPFPIWDGPLIVLTNRGTASGAESVAAALQDYGRALVVGDQGTGGFGTLRSVLDVGGEIPPDGEPLKLGKLSVTTLQLYRVNGDSTQGRGLIPDVAIPTDAEDLRRIQDCYSVAEPQYDQIAPIEHANLARLVAEQKAELQARSDRRREKSVAFRALLQKFEQSHAAKTQKYASLNEQRARQEGWASSDNSSAENVDGPLFQPDAVNDEVVAIAADYLNVLKGESLRIP